MQKKKKRTHHTAATASAAVAAADTHKAKENPSAETWLKFVSKEHEFRQKFFLSAVENAAKATRRKKT